MNDLFKMLLKYNKLMIAKSLNKCNQISEHSIENSGINKSLLKFE